MLSVNVLGVTVQAITLAGLLTRIETAVRRREHIIIAHANIHGLNLAQELPWYRDFLNRAALVFCDGYGVKWAARLLGQTLPARLTYADWMWPFGAFAAERGLTCFFLGARPGVAEAAAERWCARCPGLRVVGTQDGFFDQRSGSEENRALVARLNDLNPDVLILGMGMPTQERWLDENWAQLKVPVALPAGAVFDYLSGGLRRGPRWMTDHGLEWLARLLIEPQRLWRRYLVGNPLFVWRVLGQRFGWRRYE